MHTQIASTSTTRRHTAAGEAAQGYEKGALAREQLVLHATRIFAAKGYAAAATREICQAAGVNIAAIHYYFGGKEELYRAVLTRPIHAFAEQFGGFDDAALPFEQAMRRLLAPFVRMALDDNNYDLQVIRLHLREMLEPTAVFRDVVSRNVMPHHQALADLLARHCGLARPDADIHQLAFALVALANDYCISREVMRMLAPDVLSRADAGERILDRLVGYSIALVAHEQARRARPATPAPRSARKPPQNKVKR
jgi:AcrR family transcriptional regulator